MPTRAPHPCVEPGCPTLVTKGSRCARHAREHQQRLDAVRPSPSQRGYDSNWRRIRIAFLRKHPWCSDPYDIHLDAVRATQVDHIKPIKEGGTNDQNNLQGLCQKCHSRKTALEDGRWG